MAAYIFYLLPRIVDYVCLRLSPTPPPARPLITGLGVVAVRVYFSSENLLLAYQRYKVRRKLECVHLAFGF